MFCHAKVISHWTSELQNELWEHVVGAAWPFEEIETHIFMRAAHVSPSQKLPLAKAELKGQAQRKKGTIDTLVFFSQRGSPVPNVFSGDERRRGGGLRDRTGKQIQRGPVSMPWLCV